MNGKVDVRIQVHDAVYGPERAVHEQQSVPRVASSTALFSIQVIQCSEWWSTHHLCRSENSMYIPYVFSGQGIVSLSPLPIPKLGIDYSPNS